MDGAAPEILSVELQGDLATVRRSRWSSPDPVVDAVGRYGGSALALAIVHAARAAGESEMPFVVAVGEAVLRGLPTAARACVASRVPLSGHYADGHVGGLFGQHLVASASALVVRGRVSGADAVLVIDARGDARVERAAGLEQLGIPGRTRLLHAQYPGAALLVCGLAGDRGVPFATLANEADPPSFVGRGGLGAVLGRHGVRAIAVLPPERRRAVDASARSERRLERPGAPDLAVLTDSVRLLARAAGGTFESRGDPAPVDPGGRKGCRGCPTPCGWVFERPSGALGARQGALEALRGALGLSDQEGPLALLERCDALGIDAKETGAALALLVEHADRLGAAAGRARGLRGDLDALLAVLDEIPARVGLGALVARGAAHLARELGVDAPLVRGQSARAENDLAALLGQCISTRGTDPMRTFAFLAADVPDRARLARLIAPWPLPEGAEDPRATAGKGRLVAWTEAFLAAVDATGFCAFSAAAVLADGVLDLDGLARWIAPEAVRATIGSDGRALLSAGASIVLVQRDLARALGARGDEDCPPFAASLLGESGMLPEYRRFRGLGADGAPTAAAWGAAATTAVLDLAGDEVRAGPLESVPAAELAMPRRLGRVRLRAPGPLGAALGAPLEVELALPARAWDVLLAAALARPSARAWLVRGESAVPIVSRGGVRVPAEGRVEAGDVLDLTVVLSGG
ncbi:MAG: hypothetical protein NTY35_08740 [Planctomycetota bacterium]|nr:hypothetical protein [Planctomycetota bacterium]